MCFKGDNQCWDCASNTTFPISSILRCTNSHWHIFMRMSVLMLHQWSPKVSIGLVFNQYLACLHVLQKRSITVCGETVASAQWKEMQSFLDTYSSIATTPSWSNGVLLYSRATVTWVPVRLASITATLCLRSKRTSFVFGSTVRYGGNPKCFTVFK